MSKKNERRFGTISVEYCMVRRMVRRISQKYIEYMRYLMSNGINVTIRREMGRDIDGACGQLRKKYMER